MNPEEWQNLLDTTPVDCPQCQISTDHRVIEAGYDSVKVECNGCGWRFSLRIKPASTTDE